MALVYSRIGRSALTWRWAVTMRSRVDSSSSKWETTWSVTAMVSGSSSTMRL